MAVEPVQVELTLNGRIYVGFAILDLSKRLMNDFHYNYIKTKYPDSTLLFTDADYLRYQIQMENVYENFYADKHLLNFSGYEKESLFYTDENKKVIDKIKGELNRNIMEELVGMRLKMYWLKTKKEEINKEKGMKKNVPKKNISHEGYVDCLFEEIKLMHTM